MSVKAIFQNRLLPLDYVSLGRFITDLEYPQREFHSPVYDNSLVSSTFSQEDVKELLLRNKGSGSGYHLTEAISLFKSNGTGDGAYVTATAARRYELQQWNTVFRSACAQETTRRWLEDAIENGNDVYFIVGYRTFQDPKIAELASKSNNHGIELQVPISTVVEANVPGLMLGGVVDPGVSSSRTNEVRGTRSFETTGESVYAVEYCKLKFSWYSSKKIEKSSLGETKWKIHWRVRGDEMEEDDVVEAGVEPDLDGENIL